MEKLKYGYWFCEHCTEEVALENVTFQELHDRCGHSVVWIESGTNTIEGNMGNKMTQQEIIKKLIIHYSQTVNCDYCLVENCGIEHYESQRKCEEKIKMAYINAEK